MKLCGQFKDHRKGALLNYKRWKAVMSHHRREDFPMAGKIQFFMALFRTQGYKWVSVGKAIGDVQHCMRHDLQAGDRLRFFEARRFAARQSLREAVKKAPKWTRERLQELRDRMPIGLRSLVDLLMVVPLRPSCLKFLFYRCAIRGEDIRYVITGGKIIASQQDIMPRSFKVSEFLPSTINFLTDGPAQQRIFEITTQGLNRALKDYAQGRRITSYSIRNCAINHRIDLTRDALGVPDYERAKISTGHRQTKSLSGSYESVR